MQWISNHFVSTTVAFTIILIVHLWEFVRQKHENPALNVLDEKAS